MIVTHSSEPIDKGFDIHALNHQFFCVLGVVK